MSGHTGFCGHNRKGRVVPPSRPAVRCQNCAKLLARKTRYVVAGLGTFCQSCYELSITPHGAAQPNPEKTVS